MVDLVHEAKWRFAAEEATFAGEEAKRAREKATLDLTKFEVFCTIFQVRASNGLFCSVGLTVLMSGSTVRTNPRPFTMRLRLAQITLEAPVKVSSTRKYTSAGRACT